MDTILGSPKNSEQTKHCLIQAAGILFAQHGFKHVTVRDIIESANANLGALNYHFGTKEALFGEVLKMACEADRIDLGEFEGLSAEETLIGITRESLIHYVQPIEESWPHLLLMRESRHPSHMFDMLVEEHFTYQAQAIQSNICQVLGLDIDHAEVGLALVSLVGLKDMYGMSKPLITSVMPELDTYLKDHERLAKRIVKQALSSVNS